MLDRRTSRLLAGATGAGVGFGAALLLGRSPLAVLVCAGFAGIVAVASVVDLQERRIPNRLTYPGSLAAIAIAGPLGPAALGQALGGLLLAGGMMSAMWYLSRGRLGLGDVLLVLKVRGE